MESFDRVDYVSIAWLIKKLTGLKSQSEVRPLNFVKIANLVHPTNFSTGHPF